MFETLALVRWEADWPLLLATFFLSYLLGSIPFGLIFGWLAGAGDIRKIGSGNIGATNVLRTGRKELAILTLVCDVLKGTLAVVIANHVGGQDLAILAALGAFLGHLFPIWLRFRGGKGVATYIGILIALAWHAAVVFCLVWLAVAAVSRYSSLAALVASLATPLFLWSDGYLQEAQLFALFTVLLWIKHASNIARLATGSEGKIGTQR
jgi:glycerol-3-phosphate acyltransferase PlsY